MSLVELFTLTCAEESIGVELTPKMIQSLSAHPQPFCLFLVGGLGAGKTTLVRELLRGLGLAKTTTVNSPTFTYIHEYKIDEIWFAHLDLYRLIGEAYTSKEFLLNDYREYSGYFVEWAEEHGEKLGLTPTHKIIIDIPNDDSNLRKYSFFKVEHG